MTNEGIGFHADWFQSFEIDESEIRDAAMKLEQADEGELSNSIVKRLIGVLDLTSLKATDTPESIDELIQASSSVVRTSNCEVAAVCVYQPFIKQCKEALHNTQLKVATVAGGFPSGQMNVPVKIADIEYSLNLGAEEIDLVINRSFAFQEDWQGLYAEVSSCKEVIGNNAKLKVILGTGDLKNAQLIAKASLVCMMAGADFVKTSTGYEQVNATLFAGVIMAKAIRHFYNATGIKVGLKPAGGIRSAIDAFAWYKLVEQELGEDWLTKDLFRIGASSLLDDLTKRLA